MATPSFVEQLDARESFQVDDSRNGSSLSWLYNLAGGVGIHHGTFYEIVRIRNTYSDRVINGKADPPIVPWPGARVIADRVDRMDENQIRISMEGCEVDEDGELIPTDDRTSEIEREEKEIQDTINSDIFKSLPIIQPDNNLHFTKSPRTIQEIENLLSVKGSNHFVQLLGKTLNDKLVFIKYGKSLTDWMDDKKSKFLIKLKLIDLSSNNILYKNDKVIICDLESRWTTSGTRAPEVCQGKEYDKKSEIYAIGTLLWAIENKNMPRAHASLECTGIFKDIMEKCLAVDPENRPTIEEVLVELLELKEIGNVESGLA
ncbi:uncharacterized protein I206_105035 [Kwoniella pini CBS 10737]|uniref:Serine/threonine protein kinase n=1 Tax=Kwoniella pini CBS 10737 TaxID=1296096 RepID=A0A1B9I8K8_9TREE|nr:serine/threonine protein kinase [Kwoniella pini CBS 10737]OCF51859.1 serine/threonine protein kinase [Kwoniella pini CBS 10737]